MTTITWRARPRIWVVRCATARNGFWHLAQDRKQARAHAVYQSDGLEDLT
jgi:hypothetical protein